MLGMSQEKLGERLGITFQQIQKYEKGTNRVSASKLLAAAGVLSVPVSYFFEDQVSEPDDATREVDEIGTFLLSKEGVALNQAFVQIKDPLVRKKVVALAKVLAGHDADPLHNSENMVIVKPELRT